MKKIQTAEEAAMRILMLTPEKLKMLIDGLRAQHSHLANKSDDQIAEMLGDFVGRTIS